MSDLTLAPVVIVGAGPYGLSMAAHLSAAGVPFRAFGRPMQTWQTQMPAGMRLKSPGFASSLSRPGEPYTLEQFCRETGRDYDHTELPVTVEDFVAYGQEFARRFVPNLEPVEVTAVELLPWSPDARTVRYRRGPARFRLRLGSSEEFEARAVVLAPGLSHFSHVPALFAHLPPSLVSHTAEHHFFSRFAGRRVTVLGRGASSLNAAVLLHEGGAEVTLLSRHPRYHIHTPAGPDAARSLYQKLRHPRSPLGTSLRSWGATHLPGLLQAMPDRARKFLLYKHLAPAGGVALRGRVEGRFPTLMGWRAERVETDGDALRLQLVNGSGERREHVADHLIAGTGYRIDLERLPFLAPELRDTIHLLPEGAPRLSRHFESSVRNLFFIGPAAAESFGSLLRFVAGAPYACTRVAARLARA